MARSLRFQYPGAIYHIMARGDGGKTVFERDDDHLVFLARLGEVCVSHGWRVHAWVLMGNHFHLLLETPLANLVSGMKWLLGTYSQGWNKARQRRGHVFQGRYKSIPVNASDADGYYFRVVADYIHLNPARAGLAGGKRGKLSAYRWSSLSAYAGGKVRPWMEVNRVLRSFELAENCRGRRAYVSWLEARASKPSGAINDNSLAALRRGWYLGEESFRDGLLDRVSKTRISGSHNRKVSTGLMRDYAVRDAERIVVKYCTALGFPHHASELSLLRKGDERKAILAALVHMRTGVGMDWLAQRLHMWHPGSVSRLIGVVRRNLTLSRKLETLEKMLFSGD